MPIQTDPDDDDDDGEDGALLALSKRARGHYNAASSWFSLRLHQRYELCKQAGFAHAVAFQIAEKRWPELTEGERSLICGFVRAHITEVPSAAWGLA